MSLHELPATLRIAPRRRPRLRWSLIGALAINLVFWILFIDGMRSVIAALWP